jgi:hypothetical protein
LIQKRWDGDTRGTGEVDGSWIAPDVTLLRDAVNEAGWIAESPEEHLLVHIVRACAAPDARWELTEATTSDGILVVDPVWKNDSARLRELRSAVLALIGAVAESTTFVRQCVSADGIEYHVVTGELGADTTFAGHGHLLHFRVSAPKLTEMLAGRFR